MKVLFSRSYQRRADMEDRSFTNNLLIVLSLVTEYGCFSVTSLLVVRLVAPDSSLQLFMAHSGILCAFTASR
jgi:hypothetical protein